MPKPTKDFAADVKPLTPGQHALFSAWSHCDHLVVYGSAGTGKSFLGMYLGLREVFRGRLSRLVIVRSAVQTRDIGYLPGNAVEKAEIYEQPYADIVHELTGHYGRYDQLVKEGQVEFMTTSFLRSLTWANAVVLVDEAQNMTFHELHSIMTRLGENSRAIVCGDLAQNDLKKYEPTGFGRFLRVARRIEEFGEVEMTRNDIVRSAFVKAWIVACEEEGS